MDLPTELVAAARALVATANPPLPPVDPSTPMTDAARTIRRPDGWMDNHPTPAQMDGDPEVDDTYTAWLALSPRLDRWSARAKYQSEQRQRAHGVDLELPEVVRVNPRPEDRWHPTEPLVSRPVRAEQRPRFVVPALRPTAAPRKWLPTPGEAHRVTLGGLSARLAADRLEAWIPSLLADEARSARSELDAYRTYATAATAQLPDVFSWLALVPEPVPAFTEPPTVPVVLSGIGRAGS